MAYAFCLRFDSDTETAVNAVWTALADAGVSDDMQQLGYAPHLSLAVLDDEPAPDVALEAFAALDGTPAFAIRLGGAKRFDGTSIVWLAVDGGAALSQLHQKLLEHLPVGRVREHYRVNAWTPHVTLQMEGDVERAPAVAGALWAEARSAQVTALELVRFPPVVVQRSAALT